jgi:NAD(P)-dependent dehydrogenase (short-subunit alcohol dehydrogenase family)
VQISATADGLLDGRTAVVTGAARGNGRAIALGLAGAGAFVWVADLDLAGAEQTVALIAAAGGRAAALRWDIARADHAVAAVEAIRGHGQRIGVLVNNAGIETAAQAGDAGYAASWRRVLGVNLDGTMQVIEALLPDLIATRGCIVNVASVQAFVALQGGASAYAVSKGALAQYTRSLAVELASSHVRVNAIAPGFMNTDMTAGTRSDANSYQHFIGRTPMRRFGEPAELVGPVLFLVSSLSSYVTGVVLPVDGGLLAQ